jgi:hypothetical protein
MDEEFAEGCIRAGAAVGFATASSLLVPIGSTLVGACAGQMCDMLPYVNHAIPEAISHIGNAFTDGDTVRSAASYLEGNLDKIGAAAGFLGALRKYKFEDLTLKFKN